MFIYVYEYKININKHNQIMGNNASNDFNGIDLTQCLKSDRLINLEPKVTIGVNGHCDKTNPFGMQQVRFGENGTLKELKAFSQSDTVLTYEFSGDARLQIMKIKNDIVLHIRDPESDINTTKLMCPTLRDFFKNPHFASPQFDEIEGFIKQVDQIS